MYFVYILQSRTSSRFYVGSTNDLIRRFNQHQSRQSPATRHRGPWWMPYYETYSKKSEAVKREYEIKRKRSSNSIRRIIHSVFPEIELP
jgi:putative endonuclease